jgi:spermidine synthase
LILIFLALGYFLGGRWADHSPKLKTMYAILAWGAFAAGCVPLISRFVLRLAAQAFDQLEIGVLVGSFTAVLVLFSLPVTMLGCTSPFAIRLAISDPQYAGQVSGKIYAVSTLGSFIGTFLPVLIFIPLIGTTNTFLVFSGILVCVALAGLWNAGERKAALQLAWMPVVLFLLGVLFARQPIKTSANQIFETESAYNYIQVLEENGYRMLRLNEGQGIHSMWHRTELDYQGPWEQFLAAPFFNASLYTPDRVKRIAIIGLAAGTLARQASEVFDSVKIDGFEIDPKIIEVGQQYFGMNLPNLNAIAQDGRYGLAQSQGEYDLIAIDAYRPPYIPWHMTTQEFFELVDQKLTDNGSLAINVGRAPDDRRLIDGLVATLKTVFPSVYVMDIPNTFNSMIYATRQPTSIENLYQNYLENQTAEELPDLLARVLERMVVYQQPLPSAGTIFTDDRAPIEWLTNNLVLNYIFSGDLENLD